MTTPEPHICSNEGCETPAATLANGNISEWCEYHLGEWERQRREEDSPGWRTVFKQLKTRLPFTPSSPEMCCNGAALKEQSTLRVGKWAGLGAFDYRAVQLTDGLYTIRRTNRGWGTARDSLYWEWCQCGGWLRHDTPAGLSRSGRQRALRSIASSAAADRIAWRLQKGLPTYPDKLAIAAAALVIAATVVEATLEVLDLVD